ncbi:MAG: phosphoenolpyruvate--protein phosphotransferase [Erysipelotrichaceae bacterium]|nr:phosphoenolpyruvate--protein phosphotransferase [Erysipelotrichaceae bacterium]
MLKGIGTKNGIQIGKVYKFEKPSLSIKEEKGEAQEEMIKLERAITKTIEDIETIKKNAVHLFSNADLEIFDAHLSMVNDPEYLGQIKETINKGYSAVWSTKIVSDNMYEMFVGVEDEYLKERKEDIKDVSTRVLCNLLGVDLPDLSIINEKVIVVADELTPADTAKLNRELVLGFVTEKGSRNSHSAIMAESLGIPCVVACEGIVSSSNHGDTIIVDSNNGDVVVNPSDEDLHNYGIAKEKYENEIEGLKSLKDKETITLDKRKIEIAANIGSPDDLYSAIENGAEGVGLLRTEVLYLNKNDCFPNEEEQFEVYKKVLELMNGKRVVIRTLDIGGDKELNYFKFENETNPFLGYRAIRFCLDRKDIFKDQIRALLRASVYGKLAIMFPMIATIDEFKEAKEFVLTQKEELLKEGVKVSDEIEIGMMVEVPAAAVLADEFAKYADFFSIGTNDLVQYSMAADRLSSKVNYLYQPLNPSILRLIKMTIDGAHKNGKWCGICGELASDEEACEILLGFGIDELSMPAAKILPIRKKMIWLSYDKAKEKIDNLILKD